LVPILAFAKNRALHVLGLVGFIPLGVLYAPLTLRR
jgi:hypothetical protein